MFMKKAENDRLARGWVGNRELGGLIRVREC